MLPDDGRVVSHFIVHALNGEALPLYGDGSQTLSFCFVDDLIEGMIRLMDDAYTGETIVLVKVGQPMSAFDALRSVYGAAHPRPVECSWPVAASRSPVGAALSRGTCELGSKLFAPGSITAMMASTGYLLDSHVLLWWWFDPQRLPEGVLALLSDAETPIVVSSASVWELSITQSSSSLCWSRPIRNSRPSLAASFGRIDQRGG